MMDSPCSRALLATLDARDRVWRLDAPLAMMTRSNRPVMWEVLNTLMSWALTSSSASMTKRCCCVRFIGGNIPRLSRGVGKIELVLSDISGDGGRQAIVSRLSGGD